MAGRHTSEGNSNLKITREKNTKQPPLQSQSWSLTKRVNLTIVISVCTHTHSTNNGAYTPLRPYAGLLGWLCSAWNETWLYNR